MGAFRQVNSPQPNDCKDSEVSAMHLNLTLINGGKAQELQPRSLRALVTSLTSATSFLGVAILCCVLICFCPRLAVLMQVKIHDSL